MHKAIAVQAVFLIAVISIFLFFLVGIFWGWIGVTKGVTSEATCKASWISYCSGLAAGKTPPNWNGECSQYNIQKPSNVQDCCIRGFENIKCTK